MKLIKFKKFKIIAFTICNLTLFLFLYYHHRDYLSQGAIVCYGENCDQLKIDQSYQEQKEIIEFVCHLLFLL